MKFVSLSFFGFYKVSTCLLQQLVYFGILQQHNGFGIF